MGDIIQAPDLGPDASTVSARALALAREVETLEPLYSAWAELNSAWRSARAKWKTEEQRLVEQGALLLGAMRAAAGSAATGEGLALPSMADEAEQKLKTVQVAFREAIEGAEKTFAIEVDRLRGELIERVTRLASAHRPVFRLAVRVVGTDARILHLHRLDDDDAVMALFALTGRVPSRFGFLTDDSLDDVGGSPAVLYADEGVGEGVRPAPAGLRVSLESRAQMWPVKGQLPFFLTSRLARWVARGAVLEAELADGESFRNVLTKQEAEQLTGQLLALKLAGKIEFELVRD